VKTGTSSDFRDTWTVGFTRDYTVGTWVGNFDGSAMRGVSGVTGAGPLWNRIMLHLYEKRDDPPPFPAPRGFVRATICATTGHAPSHVRCPGIVQEWVRPDDLALVKRLDAPASLQILFPHDGDVFVRNPAPTAVASREQQIALRAAGVNRSVGWSVNGVLLTPDAGGEAFWPLRVGTWRIEARAGAARESVTIRVVPPPRNLRPGFAIGRRVQ
jgi:penicillin-binding protein 1C